jgi:hypothetical protein
MQHSGSDIGSRGTKLLHGAAIEPVARDSGERGLGGRKRK